MKRFKSFIKEHVSKHMSIQDLAKKHKVSIKHIQIQIDKGSKEELEHTKSKKEATRIAMDHLYDDPNYYTKLEDAGLTEDAPVNNVGSGKIGGCEPGQAPPGNKFMLFNKVLKRKKKKGKK